MLSQKTTNTRMLERLERSYPTPVKHHIRPHTLQVPLLGQNILRRLSYDSRLRAPSLAIATITTTKIITRIVIIITVIASTQRRLSPEGTTALVVQEVEAVHRVCVRGGGGRGRTGLW
jgi:hypothetical protein